VLYVLADEYDDEHILRTEPYFEQAGYRTFVASNTLDVVRGFHECYGFTPATPDMLMDDVQLGDFDVILFAGGDGVSSASWLNDRAAHRLAQQAMEQEVVIAAIGDAPALLARAGLLEGRTVTVLHDPGRNQIADEWIRDIESLGAIFVDQSPVHDGSLITAGRASAAVVWAILEVVDEQNP
jgi:putative intracellular protease/amidase